MKMNEIKLETNLKIAIPTFSIICLVLAIIFFIIQVIGPKYIEFDSIKDKMVLGFYGYSKNDNMFHFSWFGYLLMISYIVSIICLFFVSIKYYLNYKIFLPKFASVNTLIHLLIVLFVFILIMCFIFINIPISYNMDDHSNLLSNSFYKLKLLNNSLLIYELRNNAKIFISIFSIIYVCEIITLILANSTKTINWYR